MKALFVLLIIILINASLLYCSLHDIFSNLIYKRQKESDYD